MTTPLMISVAGVRGIVGESLTPPVLARFAAAFARTLGAGPVVVGRDARRSGPMVLEAVTAGLTAAGRDVVDIGLATTPTTQIAVEDGAAAGGVILTASHNPAEWNALKFLSARGEFLDADAGAAVRTRYESGADLWVPFDRLGATRGEARALERHLDRVTTLDVIDVPAIARRGLRVVVDGCASVGGVAVPALLARLGASMTEIDCVPNGNFTRVLEPLPEHLGALGAAVRAAGADLGIALDPDADRAAFVDAAGVPLGEELTLALAARVVLAKHPGPVVTNLSTSSIMDAVCARAGVALHRTPVGEAHVVAGMRRHGAIVGGEGNGGVILPAAHYGRDGLVAMALIAQAVTAAAKPLRALADELPRLAMVKSKLPRPDGPWEGTASRLRAAFPEHAADTADGLRLARDGEWVHVRPSGTEPVVRVIAEARDERRTLELIERARGVLAAGAREEA
ncbi:MAG: phosphoglucosamine mutase [Candidatus Eisenbacteria bacterium]|uniref:Phosphoglucosamine mutase n=1 Tax=Eiseniibacteriota bacterium TaxID=2212470 RepID=A0A9D6LA40_UNCEI|nr:phosphoglucosamine mutase [Candidatus Eisenbacteria bacterium]MBI3539418.1 phosphoglucosamine mutase [Candidatus Eisenbacteria bacterium]